MLFGNPCKGKSIDNISLEVVTFLQLSSGSSTLVLRTGMHSLHKEDGAKLTQSPVLLSLERV